MLSLLPTDPLTLKRIKVVSCLLMAGGLGVVVSKLSGLIPDHSLLDTVFRIASVALLFHVVEAIAAVILAYRLQENPIKAGVYSFWTGIAGITEMLIRLEHQREINPSS